MKTISLVDLRQREREPVAIPVSLVLKADELNLDASTVTINMSLSGVRVLTKLALVPRQEVKIVINGQFSRTIPARVVWVRQDESSSCTIAGLKFLLYPIEMAA
jgi:hypothetical protein